MYQNLLVALSLLLSVAVNSAEVLDKNDFVGSWWTDSASTGNKNQKLIIKDDFSAKWISSFGGGREFVHTASKENIKFIDGFLFITFTYEADATLNKFVLSGWKSKDRSRIFGSLYMYKNAHDMISGVPVSFENGEGHFLPGKVRKMLSIKREGSEVTDKYLKELIEEIIAISGEKDESEPNLVAVSSEKPNISTIYTKPGHAAHPMVFMMTSRVILPGGKLRFKAVYAGNEIEANKLHESLKSDVLTVKKQVSDSLKDLFQPLLKQSDKGNLPADN